MTLDQVLEQADRFLMHFDGDEQLKTLVSGVSHYDLGKVEQGIQDIVSTGEVKEGIIRDISSGEQAVEAYRNRVEESTRKHLSHVEEQAENILGLREAYVGAVDAALVAAIKDLDDARDVLSREKDLKKKSAKREIAQSEYEKVKGIVPFANPKPGVLMSYHAHEHLSDQVRQIDSEIDSLVEEYLSSPMTKKEVKRFRKASKVSGFGKGDLAERCKRYDYPEGREQLKQLWDEVSSFSADDYAKIAKGFDEQSQQIKEYSEFLESFSGAGSDFTMLASIKDWKDSFKSGYEDSLYFGKAARVVGLARENVLGQYDKAISQVQDAVTAISKEVGRRVETREQNAKHLQALIEGKALIRKIEYSGVDVQIREDVTMISKSIIHAQHVENEYGVLKGIEGEAVRLEAGLDSGITESIVNQYVGLRKEADARPDLPGEYHDRKANLESGLQQMCRGMERGMYTMFQTAQEEGKPVGALQRMVATLDTVHPQTGFLEELDAYTGSQAEKKAQMDERIAGLHQEIAGYQNRVDQLTAQVESTGSTSETLQEQIVEGRENISKLSEYIRSLKKGHAEEIGSLTEELSVQAGRLASTESQIEDKIYREKENLKRELSGKEQYSLTDYLKEGTQPYSFGALKLQNAVTSGKPWMERLQDLGSELESMSPMWHASDIDYTKRLHQGLSIEAKEGELKTVLSVGPRKEVYGRIMETFKNYITVSEKAL